MTIPGASFVRRATLTSTFLLLLPFSAGAEKLVDLIRTEQDVSICGAKEYDWSGYGTFSLAVGDLDQDGFVDAVIGVTYGDGPAETRENAGEVRIVYGPFLRGECLDLGSIPDASTVHGAFPGDHTGEANVVADVSGEGVPDLVIGSRDARGGAGAAYVLFGPFPRRTTLDLAIDADIVALGRAPDDVLGTAVAAGDVSGDGIPDLVLGAPGTTNPARPGAPSGAAHVFFGPFSSGTVLDLAVAPSDATIYGEDGLGEAVATGDVSGDGAVDLLLGAPSHDVGSTQFAGAAYIFFAPLLPSTVDLALQLPDVLIEGTRGPGFCGAGARLMTSDLSGDGRADLIIASPSCRGAGWEGAVDVFFGPVPRGTQTDLRTSDASLIGDNGSPISGLGTSMAVGDLSGDGRADLIVGATGETHAICVFSSRAGAVYGVYGPLVRGQSVPLQRSQVPRLNDFEVWAASDRSILGESLALADLSGDGYPDLMVSAPGTYVPSCMRARGSIEIIFGGPGLDCLPRPRRVRQVVAVRRGDDVVLGWDVATDANTDRYVVWKRLDGEARALPCTNGGSPAASRSAVCTDVPRATPTCTDPAAITDPPALAFYQVRGLCANGTEGLHHGSEESCAGFPLRDTSEEE